MNGEHRKLTIYNRLVAFNTNLFVARPKFDHTADNMACFDPSSETPIACSALRDFCVSERNWISSSGSARRPLLCAECAPKAFA
jgi:hypothetical protein